MMDKLKLIGAGLLAAFAIIMWYAFIRPVAVQTSFGTISEKLHKPAGTYTITPSGLNRGFRMPTNVPIAAAFLLVIRLEDTADTVAAVVNEIQGNALDKGQRVRVKWVKRGLPLVWQRITVTEVLRDSL